MPRPGFLVVVVLLLLALPAGAEEATWFHRMLTPSEAVEAIPRQLRGMDRNAQWKARPKLAAAYLDAWTGKGYTAKRPEDVLALQDLNRTARRFAQAAAAGLPLAFDDEAPVRPRVQAAATIAALLLQDEVQTEFGEDGVLEIAKDLEVLARSDVIRKAPVDRSRLLFHLATFHDTRLDGEKVLALNVEAARASPGSTVLASKAILRALMGATTDVAKYPVLRERAKARFDELRALAAEYKRRAEKAGDASAVSHAEASLAKLMGAEAPVSLLGEEAPDWTLVEAFGDVKSLQELRGKVVVIDFWATWCTWCIKSFPAIHDLVRDYESQDLVIVGATIPDPKLERAEENEILRGFIPEHEMTWPVVMIDADEPEAKYGLRAWPHAVVIDRKGRIRFFKTGALLRKDAAKVKHFREVLDRLLSEAR